MVEGGPPRPRWTSPREGLALFARGATLRAASVVALVVGTLLSLINQGTILWQGDATAATWVRVALNYCVPFLVASWGFLAACRDRERP